jgi:hypothetical protein
MNIDYLQQPREFEEFFSFNLKIAKSEYETVIDVGF